jgi:integrase
MSKSLGYIYRKPGRSIWMMKYYQDGRPIRKTTGTDDETEAQAALNAATTDAGRGVPTEAKVGKITVDAALASVLDDYDNNDFDSRDDAEGRIRNHLTPFFGGRKMTAITTPQINAYIKWRRAGRGTYSDRRGRVRRRAKASNATINRELSLLGRGFTLAHQARLLVYMPYIPKLEERNVRKGFFDDDAFEQVCARLTPEVADVARVAYVTGWRTDSEILTLEWPQIELKAGTVTLYPDTTKNREGRVFPMTGDLRAVFERRQARREAMLALGHICPFVFFREVAAGRRGLSKQHRAYTTVAVEPKRIKRFNKQWKTACAAAGCPGRTPHDFRRTAIRNMSRRGVPERVAMQLAGHKTRAVFDRYRIVNEADLREAQAKLEGQVSAIMGTPAGTPNENTTTAATKSAKTLRKFGGAARI